MEDWDRLVDAWKATLRAVERLGGHTMLDSARSAGIRHSKVWGLDIAAPAPEADVERVEGQLGIDLPVALRCIFLRHARSIDFRWQLPKDFILPPAFRGLFSGGFSLSLDALPGHENLRREMAEDCFHNPDDPYDAVWHQKLAVMDVLNGDQIGIDLRVGHHGEVVYLSHDDGEGHGYVLGAGFIDFLRRWTPLGCPGAEDWQWLPFTSSKTSMLDPDGEMARRWREALGLDRPS